MISKFSPTFNFSLQKERRGTAFGVQTKKQQEITSCVHRYPKTDPASYFPRDPTTLQGIAGTDSQAIGLGSFHSEQLFHECA